MNKKVNIFLSLFLILMLEAIFFRSVLPLNSLIGNLGDARLNNLILEHWYQVFSSNENIRDLSIFYPITNTISYTDMLLIFSIPYTLLRFIGIDMYITNKFTLILTHVIGSYAFFYFLNRKAKISLTCSLLGVAIFSYSSAYYVKTIHTQLFAISLLPLLLIFLYDFLENIQKREISSYAIAVIITFEIIMYTSFYIAYFTALFCFVAMLIYIFPTPKNNIKNIAGYLNAHKRVFVIYAVIAIMLSIPFFLTYMPTQKLYGRRSWEETLYYLPYISDFINTGTGNLIMGNFTARLGLHQGEWSVGFSPFVIILFFISLCYAIKNNKSWARSSLEGNYFKTLGSAANISEESMLTILCLTIIACLLLVLRIGNFSLWRVVYSFFPGAGAIRATSRLLFFLTLPMSITISLSANEILNEKVGRQAMRGLYGILLIVLILAANFNIKSISSWNRQAEIKMLSSVPAPPRDCKTMYIIDSSVTPDSVGYKNQLDAWSIAEHYKIKTINGYSGQFPHEWGLFNINMPDSRTYLLNANRWLRRYSLTNVYAYDIATRTWKEPRSLLKIPSVSVGEKISFAKNGNGQIYFDYGLSHTENEFTWTSGKNGTLHIPIDSKFKNTNLVLKISLQYVFNKAQRLTAKDDHGHIIFDQIIRDGTSLINIPVKNDTGEVSLYLEYPDAISPASLGMSEDDRVLAFAINSIAIKIFRKSHIQP